MRGMEQRMRAKEQIFVCALALFFYERNNLMKKTYKKKEKTPTRIIVVPHYIGTEKDSKVFKKIFEEKVQKKLNESA
jgi:hypothetical protein